LVAAHCGDFPPPGNVDCNIHALAGLNEDPLYCDRGGKQTAVGTEQGEMERSDLGRAHFPAHFPEKREGVPGHCRR
jgi:hypothetical protein